MSFNDVVVVSVKGNDCRIHLWYIIKDEGVNLLQNSNLSQRKIDHFEI